MVVSLAACAVLPDGRARAPSNTANMSCARGTQHGNFDVDPIGLLLKMTLVRSGSYMRSKKNPILTVINTRKKMNGASPSN